MMVICIVYESILGLLEEMLVVMMVVMLVIFFCTSSLDDLGDF